jgi:hypothetical protein
MNEVRIEKEKQYKIWHEKMRSMISYDTYTPTYFTGKEIKETMMKCIEIEEALCGTAWSRHREFRKKYIDSERPLSDKGWYCLVLKPVHMDEPVLLCYRKKDV